MAAAGSVTRLGGSRHSKPSLKLLGVWGLRPQRGVEGGGAPPPYLLSSRSLNFAGFFGDTGGFTAAAAEVVELGAADVAAAHDVDF